MPETAGVLASRRVRMADLVAVLAGGGLADGPQDRPDVPPSPPPGGPSVDATLGVKAVRRAAFADHPARRAGG